MIIDVELVYDKPIKNYCGSCNKCIEACPTNAITSSYIVDSRKCISYQTIENKVAINADLKGKFENWIFGCDICQDVCTWNKKILSHNEPALLPHSDLLTFTKDNWKSITEDKFKEIFKGSAVKRTKYCGLKRNIEFCGSLSHDI